MTMGVLVVVGVGCGSSLAPDPTMLPSGLWGTEFAVAECARIFACCNATEQMRWGYADEAQCRTGAAADVQRNLDQLLSIGWISYDAQAARRCVDEITTLPCTELVAVGKNLFGPSCVLVSRGTGKIGATCEDLDVVCESSNCLPGPGTCGPTRGCAEICPVGQFCDTTLPACAPLKGEGVACSSNGECTFPLTCQSGVCARLRPGGGACVASTDCASGTCTGGVCDEMACHG